MSRHRRDSAATPGAGRQALAARPTRSHIASESELLGRRPVAASEAESGFWRYAARIWANSWRPNRLFHGAPNEFGALPLRRGDDPVQATHRGFVELH